MNRTTINLSSDTRDKLAELKIHKREPYEEVIKYLLDCNKGQPRKEKEKAIIYRK